MVSIHAPAWGATNSICPLSMRSSTFQSTRPRGARPIGKSSGHITCSCFNPRARVGRDHQRRKPPLNRMGFQSTRPRGARLSHLSEPLYSAYDSIHAPAWGATSRSRSRRTPHRSFNPRARVGRDRGDVVGADQLTRFQSTRPRGARPARGQVCMRGRGVSIHAPAWGATAHDRASASGVSMFQSTRPRGARQSISRPWPRRFGVSIHAPAWGATPGRRFATWRVACFNPRARVGRDLAVLLIRHRLSPFQSTRPRGARRSTVLNTAPSSPFQSTRPRGARP